LNGQPDAGIVFWRAMRRPKNRPIWRKKRDKRAGEGDAAQVTCVSRWTIWQPLRSDHGFGPESRKGKEGEADHSGVQQETNRSSSRVGPDRKGGGEGVAPTGTITRGRKKRAESATRQSVVRSALWGKEKGGRENRTPQKPLLFTIESIEVAHR